MPEKESVSAAWLKEVDNIMSRNLRGRCSADETLWALQRVAVQADLNIPEDILRTPNTISVSKIVRDALRALDFGVEYEFLRNDVVCDPPDAVWCALIERPNSVFHYGVANWTKREVQHRRPVAA
jgi:hypothetical protein